mmetsp:Transcript_85036/g.104260  ORF Transcript_85036/g.104260 Transcript_85036/m.104260 type:complete len:204 (+) Transcript_85036:61-672(+)|eukprot:CAMPEP_0114639482 /NCGR_PEP_ID=MMETSP0191-20121206/1192_1 /TAXON_ID=126664 /ORGANISM="Sorites sp." /LENGTH=203 /DNA_ID=CAMNT_0001851349 /DNA_START=58 /DNA_END=669 /DNA_ORIENTATION=+
MTRKELSQVDWQDLRDQERAPTVMNQRFFEDQLGEDAGGRDVSRLGWAFAQGPLPVDVRPGQQLYRWEDPRRNLDRMPREFYSPHPQPFVHVFGGDFDEEAPTGWVHREFQVQQTCQGYAGFAKNLPGKPDGRQIFAPGLQVTSPGEPFMRSVGPAWNREDMENRVIPAFLTKHSEFEWTGQWSTPPEEWGRNSKAEFRRRQK